MFCGECKYLQEIDKLQDGGICVLSGNFHKFHNVCDLEIGEDIDGTTEDTH